MFVVASMAMIVVFFVSWDTLHTKAYAYHSKEDIALFKSSRSADLPLGYNNFFVASGECDGCHGHDFQGQAMVDTAGEDINVTDDWRSTMMANSAKDPFWRAKVSHEVLVNPAHQAVLEDKCLSCHSPMGRHDKFLTGGGLYSMTEMHTDSMGLDGVSCAACHMIARDSVGVFFSGNTKFDTNQVGGVGNLYGPYDAPFTPPMVGFVSYEPVYSEHIHDAGLCASCHTLITETADLSGNLTGDEFVEQATYHEWLNSIYNDSVSCQSCHVPSTNQPVKISANYQFLPARRPYGLHHLAGANTFMLELLKDNIEELGLTATPAQFDSTIARTERMLQQNTLEIDMSVFGRTLDTTFIEVELENYAGHKFPSGYPARRAFIEFVVLDDLGDTLFKSGALQSDYEVEGHDPNYEPHYDVIRSQDEVQIYEMVMGDVNGDKTTVLERAKDPLKDNRLTPFGFTTTHFAYDTTIMAGTVLNDPNFNLDDMGIEGSGTDKIKYHVPMGGYDGLITISARVFYQSLPPKWMEEMFSYNSAEIDTFRNMYVGRDNTPVLIKEMEITDMSVGIDNLQEFGVTVYPNPTNTGSVRISGLSSKVKEVNVYELTGKLIESRAVSAQQDLLIELPELSGVYLIEIVGEEQNFIERVVRL